MRKTTLALLALAPTLLLCAPAAAQHRGAAAFAKMKSLAGTWQAKVPDGSAPVEVTYEVVSGGTALVERVGPGGGENMVTVYHPDGDRLVMTHYCSSGNQPRMAAEAPAGDFKSISFKFLDVTNLASPQTSYMNGLTIEFKDADHVAATWTSREGGKDVPWRFELERKK